MHFCLVGVIKENCITHGMWLKTRKKARFLLWEGNVAECTLLNMPLCFVMWTPACLKLKFAWKSVIFHVVCDWRSLILPTVLLICHSFMLLLSQTSFSYEGSMTWDRASSVQVTVLKTNCSNDITCTTGERRSM